MIVITIPLIGIGASKGSIVALALSLLVIFFVNRKVNFRFLILFIFSFLVIYNAELLFLGTLKDRFTQHSLDVNLYSSERELRYYLWNFSIDKFIDNPIFGYSLEISNNDLEILSSPAYSHNIILESLLSLGFIGGSVLVIIIIMTINNGIYIAKNKLDESWILLLFLIAFFNCFLSEYV